MLLLTAILPRLRLAFLTMTVLMVLGLNHQSVATLRMLPAPDARAAVTARTAVVKQRVNLEATPALDVLLAPAADVWLPLPLALPTPSQWRLVRFVSPRPRPSRIPGFFRVRLLRVALSPQAP